MANKIGQIQIEFVAKTDQLQGQIDAINKKISTTTSTVKAQGREWDSSVTRVQAASAAIRGFNGSMNTRAVERYIAQFKGLSTFLVKAFPVVGALALTTIVVDLGEKLYAAGEKAKNAGRDIDNAFNVMNGQAETANDELQVTNDKLENQIAKLTGHHPNTLRDELDETITAADKLADALQADASKVDELMKKYNVGFKDMLAAALLGENPMLTHHTDKAIGRDAQENENNSAAVHDATLRLHGASDVLDAANKSKDKAAIAAAQAQVDDAQKAVAGSIATATQAIKRQNDGYETELQRFYKIQRVSTAIDKTARAPGNLALTIPYALTGNAADPTANISKLHDSIRSNQDALIEFAERQKEALLKPEVANLEANKEEAAKAKEQLRQETEAIISGWRQRLDTLKNLHAMGATQEYAFWKDMATEASAGINGYSKAASNSANIVGIKDLNHHSAAANSAAVVTAYKEMAAAYQHMLAEMAEGPKRDLAQMNAQDGLGRQLEKFTNPFAGQEDILKRAEEIAKRREKLTDDMAQAQRKAGNAFREQAIQIGLATGQLSKHDAAVALSELHASQYAQTISDLQSSMTRLQNDNKDGHNDSEINRLSLEINKTQAERPIQQAADEDKINTPLGAAEDALNEWTQNALDSAAQIKELINSTLNGFNDAVVGGKRGAFQNFGKDFFKNVEKTGLQRAEGYGMKALGLGGKADGSASNPWHVIIAGSKGIASGVKGFFPGANAGSGGGNSPTNVVGSVVGNFFRHMLGFADGGDPPIGVPSLVGENGPELFVPRSAGTVVSNGKFGAGGDHYWNVDARGSNDPAQTARMIKEAMVTTHKRAVSDAVKAIQERTSRRPSTAR